MLGEMELLVLLVLGCISASLGITTYHHDKPENTSISKMATTMGKETLDPSERQKRLLPYSNYYRTPPPPDRGYKRVRYPIEDPHLYYEDKKKFTPFLESNAIPGPFRPMQNPTVQYVRLTAPPSNVPDYGAIYDKLARLKLSQNYERPIEVQQPQRFVVRPQTGYVSQRPQRPRFRIQQPGRTTIETFTPTNIDIENESYQQEAPKYQENVNKPFVTQQIAIEIPHSSVPQSYQVVESPKESIVAKPVILVQRKPVSYVTRGFVPKYVPENVRYYIPKHQHRTPPVKYPEDYQPAEEISETPPTVSTDSSNALSHILKQLQATNTLPESITTENIDNSIKTLVRILEALKKRKSFSRPIVVQDVPVDYEEEDDDDDDQELDIERFPADTPEGGTPGKPGVDYPALSSIPQTSFNCKTQRYKGFFADPATSCQVWHYCDLNGGQASFLCPNGTIFSQVALTCDWWYNVKCSNTHQLYVLNERLYKYIIPLSPKFPEDYTGPLVDKYLALKFNEMEEKMRKEKKGKERIGNEKESSELQNIDGEHVKKIAPKEPNIGATPQKETLETIEDENKN